MNAEVDADSVLVMVPAARVMQIEPAAVVLSLDGERGMRVSRGAYEVYRHFQLPRTVGEVLPQDVARRDQVLAVLRLLAGKGYLAAPSAAIPVLVGASAPASAGGGAGSP